MYYTVCRNGTDCDSEVARMYADSELTSAFNTVSSHSSGQLQYIIVHSYNTMRPVMETRPKFQEQDRLINSKTAAVHTHVDQKAYHLACANVLYKRKNSSQHACFVIKN